MVEVGHHHVIIQNWDMNLHYNLEESVICIIFYTVIRMSSSAKSYQQDPDSMMLFDEHTPPL